MSQIINLPLTKGTSVKKFQEFYGKLTRSYDALETLGESEMLKGFVLTTLNKLPHINPVQAKGSLGTPQRFLSITLRAFEIIL